MPLRPHPAVDQKKMSAFPLPKTGIKDVRQSITSLPEIIKVGGIVNFTLNGSLMAVIISVVLLMNINMILFRNLKKDISPFLPKSFDS